MKSNIISILCFLCITLMLTGCSLTSSLSEEEPIENKAFLEIGRHLAVNNTNESLILYDYKEALAGDGMYYASWVIGDSEPYENSDGDTIDLYDAQLYLLLGEFTSSEKAQENKDAWLDRGRSNYVVSGEKEIDCSGQIYQMITYTFQNEDNPYARGVSAFAVHDRLALCIELTCQEEFTEDLEAILTNFLENCTINNQGTVP
ncbi:MAG: hypothetical protein K2G51_05990 [Lachnospiraceae bacterium]|nr:hypothetical protein [Lachnospiraceae bacterium]